jgi:Phasin protein
MARSSQAKGGQAAPTMTPKTPKTPVRRPAVRNKVGKTAAATARPELPAETGPVAPAPPEAKREAFAAAETAAAADPVPPKSSPTDDVGAVSHTIEAPAAAEPAAGEPLPEVEPVAATEAIPEAIPEAIEAAPEAAGSPAPAADPISMRPPWGAAQGPDLTAMLQAGRTLVEGSIRVRSQMIGLGCRRAEQGLAVGRAVLAGSSLPEVLTLQAEYVREAVDDALAQTLELGRLSTDVVRAGLESLRPR